MKNHYTLGNLKRALRNPVLVGIEVLRVCSWPIHQAYGTYTDQKYTGGIDMMDEDWDNLLILDACRCDHFERQHEFDEPARRVISPGKMSWEFMQETFLGRQFHETVYITSNPFATRLPEDTFFKTRYLIEDWDDDVGTIHPEDVVAAANEAHTNHPKKRLILHFMQPHRPYLGPTADELRKRVDLIGYRNEGDGLQIWGAVKEGKVTVEEVRTAYAETLDIVLDVVEDYLEEATGKSVITADHGEMLGERVLPFTSRVWGHSEGFSTPTLRQIPWLEIDGETRREVAESSPVEADAELNESEVESRLQALGYTE